MSEFFPLDEDEFPIYADGTRWLIQNEITLRNAQRDGFLAICPAYIEKRYNDFINFLINVKKEKTQLIFNYTRRPTNKELELVNKYYGKLN